MMLYVMWQIKDACVGLARPGQPGCAAGPPGRSPGRARTGKSHGPGQPGEITAVPELPWL
jgi:hypothetical protein